MTWDVDVYVRRPIEMPADELLTRTHGLRCEQVADGWVIHRTDRDACPVAIAKLFAAEVVTRVGCPPAVSVLMPSEKWWHHTLIGPPDISDDDLDALEKWLCATVDDVGGALFDPSADRVIWPAGTAPAETTHGVLIDVLDISLFASRPASVSSWVDQIFGVLGDALPEALPPGGARGAKVRTVKSIAETPGGKLADWRTKPPCFGGMLHAGASDAQRAQLVPDRVLVSNIPNRPAALIPEGL